MRPKRVFIVDDALDYRTLLSKAFKEAGYKVFLAKDGIEAYIKFFKVKPDLVLADILLPRMRGDVLIKWIKGTVMGKELPVVVISGHKKMKDYLYEMGVDLFFDKPITTKEVLSLSKEVLEIFDLRRAIKARLFKLKGEIDPQVKVDKPKEFVKLCESCHKFLPLTSVHCGNCGSPNLHVVEKTESTV